jgi:hypothetical protein
MDAPEPIADLRGQLKRHAAVAQFGLPHWIAVRRQIGHREQASLAILAQDGRHRVRNDRACGLEPAHLEGIAFDRRAPFSRDLQLRECPLDGEDARAGFNLPDVRGDSAGQRIGADQFIRSRQPHAHEGGRKLSLDRPLYILHAQGPLSIDAVMRHPTLKDRRAPELPMVLMSSQEFGDCSRYLPRNPGFM